MAYGQRDVLFPDDLFSDLFAAVGRRSMPPPVVATVMVLQRLEGLSDQEVFEVALSAARETGRLGRQRGLLSSILSPQRWPSSDARWAAPAGAV